MGQTQHPKIYCQRTGNLTPRGQKISMIAEESRDIYIDTFWGKLLVKELIKEYE